MAKFDLTTPQGRAAKRAQDMTAFFWHLGAYLVINTFLWLIIEGAVFWVAVPWGIGLAFHALATFLDTSGFEQRRYDQYLVEERRREQMLEEEEHRKDMVR